MGCILYVQHIKSAICLSNSVKNVVSNQYQYQQNLYLAHAKKFPCCFFGQCFLPELYLHTKMNYFVLEY